MMNFREYLGLNEAKSNSDVKRLLKRKYGLQKLTVLKDGKPVKYKGPGSSNVEGIRGPSVTPVARKNTKYEAEMKEITRDVYDTLSKHFDVKKKSKLFGDKIIIDSEYELEWTVLPTYHKSEDDDYRYLTYWFVLSDM